MAGVHREPSTRPAVKLTYDDFLLFPDDGKRHELIRPYRREGTTFARPLELRRDAGDTLTTVLLPGLAIPLEDVFAP